MNKVEELFIKKGAVIMMRDDQWFVMSKQNSVEFIDTCEKERIEILGIDGFYLHENGGTEPSMANSFDFTSSSYEGDKNNIYEDRRQFILSRENNLYFEIVCQE